MKHKHADLIHAWADGAQIQSRNDISGCWEDNRLPMWAQDTMYRIKPELKPDVVRYGEVYVGCTNSWQTFYHSKANVQYTFDGETGKLKKAEVL
jgi:hypothetical protein